MTFNVGLSATVSTVAECLKTVGDLSSLLAAVKLYAARHKRTTRKPVSEVVAELLAVKWKSNALRHSSASYRFAVTGDAGRVAGELGNSAAVVHRHYRELVKPADAKRWFAVAPNAEANFVTMSAAVAA